MKKKLNMMVLMPIFTFLQKNNNAGLQYQFKTNRIIIYPNNPTPGKLKIIIKYVSQELNIGLVITVSSFFCLLTKYYLLSPKWLGK